MRKFSALNIVCLVFLIFISCDKELDDSLINIKDVVTGETEPTGSSNNLITAFELSLADGTTLMPINQVIDQEENTITITYPFGTVVTTLNANITTSENATINESVEDIDFNEEIIFTVIAEDTTEREYTVIVTVTPISQREALLNMYIGDALLDDEYEWDLDADIGTWKGVIVENGNVVEVREDADGPVFRFDDNLKYLPFLQSIKIVDSNSPLPAEFDAFLPNLESITLELVSDGLPSWITKQTNLKNIFCFDCGLGSLPEDIGNLIKLETLSLGLNSINELPTSIKDLSNLKTLDLGENSFSVFPIEVLEVTSLESISFYVNSLVTIPADISRLKNLLSLDLRDNLFLSLPEEITELEYLTTLHIRNNDNLLSLSKEICDFGAAIETFSKDDTTICELYLTEVLLQRNALLSMYDETRDYEGGWASEDWNDWDGVTIEDDKVVRLSTDDISYDYINVNENLGALKYLREINIEYQTLPLQIITESDGEPFPDLVSVFNNEAAQSEIPQWVLNSTNLESLIIEHGDISDISGIVSLTKLQKLTINEGTFTSIPEGIGALQNLQSLDFSYNDLQSIPTSIANLDALTSLSLSGNSITSLSVIENLTSLTSLSLSSNSITSLSGIENLTSLTSLNLSRNNITTLPESIGSLTNLTYLYLSTNLLSSVPEELSNLINLNYLSLSTNLLTSVPEELSQLTNLTRLTLSSNPNLISIQQAVCDLDNLPTVTAQVVYKDVTAVCE